MNKLDLSLSRILLRSVTLVSLLLMLAGCQLPDSGLLPAVTARKGVRMKTSLSVLPARDPNATKSVYAGDEAVVYNWNLLIFENGVLKAKHYKNAGSDINFSVITDRAYRYYALANVGDITSRLTEGVTSEEDLASLWVDVSVESGLPMAWKSPSEIAFSKLQISQGAQLSVPFTRLVGRYDIVIDKSGLSAWRFTATSLSLKGVSRVQPFAASSCSTAAAVKTDEATAGDLTLLNGGQATHYYPVENCYGNLLPEGTDPWNKIPGNLAADAYPTYIEIQGRAQMTDGSGLERDVTYRFYLGENASNNFDVVRNETHTVTLVLSDAAIAANSSHWKVETGSYTDSRALAFTHESIMLPGGESVEEPVIRTPVSLQYRIEMDQNLKEAGVVVSGYQWGDPCEADRLTLSAPAGVNALAGEIRLKTLDGAKSATAMLTVGKQLRSLRIGLWPSQTEERFHSDTTVVLNQYYVYFWAHVYACYSDGTMADVTAAVVAASSYTYQATDFYNYCSSDPGKFGCTPNVGTYVLGATYTEDGITCTASASITRTHGPLTSIVVYPNSAETLLTGGNTYQYTIKARYNYTNGEFDINPDDVVWTFDDPDALEYAGGGLVRTKYKRVYKTRFKLSYTENGTTVTRYKSDINVFSNLLRITVSPAGLCLINDDVEPEVNPGSQAQYARSNRHTFEVRAYYDDGTDEDVSSVTYGIGDIEWTDNNPLKYWKDGYWHAVNAYHMTGGAVDLWRYKCREMNWAAQKMAPYWEGESYDWSMYDIDTVLSDSNPDAVLFEVAYTHNGVTASSSVYGTLTHTSQPQRIAISPDQALAYTGGKEVQFEATCHYADGSSENVGTKATWSADGLVTSNGNGRFTTGNETGTTEVHAAYSANGVTATGHASLRVKDPEITSVSLQLELGNDWVSGAQTVLLGTDQRWRVVAHYEDGSSITRYEGFTLNSSEPSIVTVNGTATQAAAIGTSTVTALFDGMASDGVPVTVHDHHYRYDLVIRPADVTMDWNGTQHFYAWYRRFDNDVLDTSFGTDGHVDVSSSASWEVDGSLLSVASWDGLLKKLTANNETTAEVTGKITAAYGSLKGTGWVKIRSSFTPALTAEPALLTWASDASGLSSGQSLVIRSNTSWKIEGADAHWSLSATSGSGDATLTVYPLARNENTADRICTLTLSASGVPNVSVTLKHAGTDPLPPAVRYKVVTSVGQPSLRVGEHTTASAVLLSSSDDGVTYPTTVSTTATSFGNLLSGEHVSISGSRITGVSAGSASIRAVFEGYAVGVYEDAAVTVTAPEEEKTLSVQPASLSWTGSDSGRSSAKSVSVSSNVNWSVKRCADGFSYEVTGTTIQIWPDAPNSSFSSPKEGSLVIGGSGVSDVSVTLSQACRVRALSGIAFDRSAYDLVRIAQGSLAYEQGFTLTASYDDGSSENVTASAIYEDQGSLIVDRSSGVLRATQVCSDKQLKASYGGCTAVAAYSAAALECPLSLSPGRMESQNDKSRNFLVMNILLEYCRAFESGTLERDVTGTVTCYPSALIVREGYDEAVGQMFHFTAEGEGSIRFVYTLNGKSVEWLLNLSCSATGKVSKR